MEQRNQEAWGRFVRAVRKAHEAGKDVGVGSDNRRLAIMAADDEMVRLRAELAAAQEIIADLRQSVERFEGHGGVL